MTSPSLPKTRPTSKCSKSRSLERPVAARTWRRFPASSWGVRGIEHAVTRWCPSSLAKLVNITPITMVYGRYIHSYIMGFINQLITGGAPPCKMVVSKGLQYPLVMTNIAMGFRWPIEIDDFPSEQHLHLWLGFSMAMLNNKMVNH